MAREIELGGNVYLIAALPALKQFHLASKLAPTLMFLANARRTDGRDPTPEQFAQMLCAGTSGLSDADREACVSECLRTVRRKSADKWAPLWTSDLMFSDLDLRSMLVLCWEVLAENRIPAFFIASPDDGAGGAEAAKPA